MTKNLYRLKIIYTMEWNVPQIIISLPKGFYGIIFLIVNLYT